MMRPVGPAQPVQVMALGEANNGNAMRVFVRGHSDPIHIPEMLA